MVGDLRAILPDLVLKLYALSVLFIYSNRNWPYSLFVLNFKRYILSNYKEFTMLLEWYWLEMQLLYNIFDYYITYSTLQLVNEWGVYMKEESITFKKKVYLHNHAHVCTRTCWLLVKKHKHIYYQILTLIEITKLTVKKLLHHFKLKI